MINGRTASGFDFSIDETKLDNIELLEAFHDLNKGKDGTAIIEIERILLGEEQNNRLKTHIKQLNDGRCTVTAYTTELTAILTAMGNSVKK